MLEKVAPCELHPTKVEPAATSYDFKKRKAGVNPAFNLVALTNIGYSAAVPPAIRKPVTVSSVCSAVEQ